MPRLIAQSTLNASTIDIMNVIRQNASYDYQQNVPEVVQASDIPKVGQVIYGTPAFANQFINALVNRIAFVRIQSSIFNNPYRLLKKGYISYGETIEEVFVSLIKAMEYSAEKADRRELKRYLPDVRSAFHAMNWRVIYPVTIQDEDLRMAFLSIEGVQDLIAKIVDQVYQSAEYDEFLLFKYLIIKALSHGKIKTINAAAGTDELKESAVNFRATSNLLTFRSRDYNAAGVLNVTPRENQVIFMDSRFNARFDVDVLASAFNMDKTTFIGRLFLIDDWTSFDNERFDYIREHTDGIEEVTAAELALLQNVTAVMFDTSWFQVYDNNDKFTEKYVASGLYWNYFYHVWKTISYSPFANAVAFVTGDEVTTPMEITVEIGSKSISEDAVVLTLNTTSPVDLAPGELNFIQTDILTTSGIGVQKYGALLIPQSKVGQAITLEAEIQGSLYKANTTINASNNVGDTVVMSKQAASRAVPEPAAAPTTKSKSK